MRSLANPTRRGQSVARTPCVTSPSTPCATRCGALSTNPISARRSFLATKIAAGVVGSEQLLGASLSLPPREGSRATVECCFGSCRPPPLTFRHRLNSTSHRRPKWTSHHRPRLIARRMLRRTDLRKRRWTGPRKPTSTFRRRQKLTVRHRQRWRRHRRPKWTCHHRRRLIARRMLRYSGSAAKYGSVPEGQVLP